MLINLLRKGLGKKVTGKIPYRQMLEGKKAELVDLTGVLKQRRHEELGSFLGDLKKRQGGSWLDPRPAPEDWIEKMKALYTKIGEEAKVSGDLREFDRAKKGYQAIIDFYYPIPKGKLVPFAKRMKSKEIPYREWIGKEIE